MPIISALWRMRQEDYEFEPSLGYIVIFGFNKTKQDKTKHKKS
jgi:hypothetical protein